MPEFDNVNAIYPLVAYPITGVDTGTEQFVIDGDKTDRILVDDVLTVIDSTGNDGEYTVAATSYAAGPDETTITVNEDITDATVDGKALHDEIADETPITLSHDDPDDRDAAVPDQVAGAHVQRLANEVRAVEKTVNIALGFEIMDAGGLVIYHSGGILNTSAGAPAEFAPGKLTLPDNDDSYIEVDPSAISQNITGFSAGKFPLAIVTTAAGSITRIEDKRAALGGGGSGGVPPPSVDNRMVRVNGINGEIQQAAGAILDDDDNIYDLVSLNIGPDAVPSEQIPIQLRDDTLEINSGTGDFSAVKTRHIITQAGTGTGDDADYDGIEQYGELNDNGGFLDEAYAGHFGFNIVDGTVQDIYGLKCQIGTVWLGASAPVVEDEFYGADIRGVIDGGTINAPMIGTRNRIAADNYFGAVTVNDIMVALENKVDISSGCSIGSDVYGARLSGNLGSVPVGIAYELYLGGTGSWDYGIYQNDNYPNYFGGNIMMGPDAAINPNLTFQIRDNNLQIDTSVGSKARVYVRDTITDAGTGTGDDADYDGIEQYGELNDTGGFLDEAYAGHFGFNIVDGTVQDIYGLKCQIGTIWFGAAAPVVEDEFYAADIRGVIDGGTINAPMIGTRNRIATDNFFGTVNVNDIMVALENKVDISSGCSIGSDVYGARLSGNLGSVPVGTAYELYLGGTGSWDYGIYQNDSYPNYLAGALEVIGITTMSGGRSNGSPTELTLDASGIITVTKGYHRVDTFADAATDDLVTINGGVDGEMLILRAENDARSVVVKDGTGNLALAGDFTLDNVEDTISLIYDSTLSKWLETGRSDNGA